MEMIKQFQILSEDTTLGVTLAHSGDGRVLAVEVPQTPFRRYLYDCICQAGVGEHRPLASVMAAQAAYSIAGVTELNVTVIVGGPSGIFAHHFTEVDMNDDEAKRVQKKMIEELQWSPSSSL